ncbi:MAG: helix-turn-helix transcriptional regulator [Gemmatimonadota bacterium]
MTTYAEVELLLTEKEAAEILGVSRRWVQERRYRGDAPPHIQLSERVIRYRAASVLKWAEEREAAERTAEGEPAEA